MIIHKPTIQIKGNEIRVSAAIEQKRATVAMPEALWFAFPRKYETVLSRSADGFVLSLLPLAMMLGEDIDARGTMSRRLAHNLDEYQNILHFWYPQKFKRIAVRPDAYKKQSGGGENAGERVMCAFSGGVDSSYTVWSHLPRNEPSKGRRLTHTLFVHGFDIPLSDAETFNAARRAYTAMAEQEGIELIQAATNAKEFLNGNGIVWGETYLGVLVGTALFFENLVSRFYYPEDSMPDHPFPPFGMHKYAAPLLSTDCLQTIPHGHTVSKLKKVQALSRWPETYNWLRVCWVKPDGLRNCCRCWKCTYIMATLDMAGALEKYRTFPLPLTRRQIRNAVFYHGTYQYYKWIRRDAISAGRKDMLFDFTVAVAKSRKKDVVKRILLNKVRVI